MLKVNVGVIVAISFAALSTGVSALPVSALNTRTSNEGRSVFQQPRRTTAASIVKKRGDSFDPAAAADASTHASASTSADFLSEPRRSAQADVDSSAASGPTPVDGAVKAGLGAGLGATIGLAGHSADIGANAAAGLAGTVAGAPSKVANLAGHAADASSALGQAGLSAGTVTGANLAAGVGTVGLAGIDGGLPAGANDRGAAQLGVAPAAGAVADTSGHAVVGGQASGLASSSGHASSEIERR